MPIREVTTVAQLTPWLPSDYSATGWDATSLQTALDDGHDPRLIAAEVWEEYAHTLPEETGESAPVRRWTNLDTSVEYAASTSPHDWAMKQARHHRARAKVRTIPLAHAVLEAEAAEGLTNEVTPE